MPSPASSAPTCPWKEGDCVKTSARVDPPTFSAAFWMRGFAATSTVPEMAPSDWPTNQIRSGSNCTPNVCVTIWLAQVFETSVGGAPARHRGLGESTRTSCDWSMMSWRSVSRVRKRFPLMRKLPEAAGFPDGAPPARRKSVAHLPGGAESPSPPRPATGTQAPPAHCASALQKLRSPCLAASMAATAIPCAFRASAIASIDPRQLPNPWRKTASGSVQTGAVVPGVHPVLAGAGRATSIRIDSGAGGTACGVNAPVSAHPLAPVGQMSLSKVAMFVSTMAKMLPLGTPARPWAESASAMVPSHAGAPRLQKVFLPLSESAAVGSWYGSAARLVAILLHALRPEGVRHHDVVARQPRGALLRHQRRCGEVDGLSHPIDAEGLRIAHARYLRLSVGEHADGGVEEEDLPSVLRTSLSPFRSFTRSVTSTT